jgi:uncharacterized membrane protein
MITDIRAIYTDISEPTQTQTGSSPASWTANSTQTTITVAACVLVAVLAAWNTAHKSAWTDELYSWFTTQGSFGHTLERARDYELQPPLYFLLLNAWRRLWMGGTGQGEIMFMRTLSTVAAVVCVAEMGAVGRLLKIERGVPPALLMALSPGLIWAATETRGYALALALSAGTLHAFLLLIGDDTGEPTPSWRVTATYGVLSYLLLMTVYYGGFVLLGQWIGAVVVGRWRRVSGALAIVGVGLLPWIPTILMQIHHHPGESSFMALSDAVFGLAQLYLSAFLRDTPILDWPHITLILLVPAVVVGAIRITRGHLLLDERAIQVAAIVPLVALSALRLGNVAPVQPRYVLITLPMLLALISLWTDRPQKAFIRYFIGTWVVLVLASGLVVLQKVGPDVADWRGVAALLTRERTDPTQPVLAVPAQDALPMRYYYKGPGIIGGMPGDFSLAVYQPEHYRITDTTAVVARLNETSATTGVWVMLSTSRTRMSAKTAQLIEHTLGAHFCKLERHDLFGETVFHATSSGCGGPA